MANSWLRLWHDMPNDPKWRTISRVSKQPIPSVIAVYVHLLVIASNANERGRTHKKCSEDIASALDIDCEQVDAIIEAMQGKVLDGDLLKGWSTRQVEREDGSAARSKAWREAKKEEKRTQTNANERKRTPDKDTDTDTEVNIKPLVASVAADHCPQREIIELYHELIPTGRQVRLWPDARQAKLRSRWREDPKRQSLDWWRKFFGYVSQSDFLSGRTQSAGRNPFEIDLEWIVTQSNFVKIIEGKYHGEEAAE